MRDFERMLKMTTIYAAGPNNDGEEFEGNFEEESDEDFISRDEVDDAFQWLAWFQREDGIIETFAEKLPIADNLTAEWRNDQFWINLNGEQHRLPLSVSVHNTYIVLSSLAYLLRDRYDIWLVKYLMDDDVHAILVTTKAETNELMTEHSRSLSRYFMPLKPGHDYFSGIDVPYLDHENHNPLFEAQRDAIVPKITQIRELIAQKGVGLIEGHRQREAWLAEQLRSVNSSEVNVEEISRMSAEFAQKEARTLDEFARKITRRRQEIAQIVEHSRE